MSLLEILQSSSSEVSFLPSLSFSPPKTFLLISFQKKKKKNQKAKNKALSLFFESIQALSFCTELCRFDGGSPWAYILNQVGKYLEKSLKNNEIQLLMVHTPFFFFFPFFFLFFPPPLPSPTPPISYHPPTTTSNNVNPSPKQSSLATTPSSSPPS